MYVTDFGINHGGICELDRAGKEFVIQLKESREQVTHIRSILSRHSPPRLPKRETMRRS